MRIDTPHTSSRTFSPGLYALYFHVPVDLPAMPEVSDRLLFTLQCHVITLGAMLRMLWVRNILNRSGDSTEIRTI